MLVHVGAGFVIERPNICQMVLTWIVRHILITVVFLLGCTAAEPDKPVCRTRYPTYIWVIMATVS